MRDLQVNASEAFRIVIDVERFPEFMKNVSFARVVAEENDRKIVDWQMIVEEVELEWREEIRYDAEKTRAEFQLVEGIFARFDGHWQVSPMPFGARIELFVEYDLGLPEIDNIIGPILKERLLQNLELMLTCLTARANC